MERLPDQLSPPGKALPHSEESERAVLAAIPLAPSKLADVRARLDPEDFYLDRHALIYRAMLAVADAGEEVDLRTLQARLEQQGVFDKIGGLAMLAGLDMDLPDLGRVDTYVELIKERSVRRDLIKFCTVTAGELLDGGGLTASEAVPRMERKALELGGELTRRSPAPLEELFEETVAHLEERCGGQLLGVSSGFPDWDRLSEGLVPGNLIIVAGRPSMGKTTLALDVARHVALHQVLPVAVFSLEMSRKEISQRLLAAESGLPYADIRAGRLSEREWVRLYDTIRRNYKAPLHVDDSAAPALFEIAAKARQIKAERGLALVVVDYLQLLSLSSYERPRGGRPENRQQEVTALSRALKVLARDLEVPVLVVSQLSRKPDDRVKNHRPLLSDLRESGAIEQDADQVVFVYRDEMYRKDDPEVKGLAELIVEKNRNGPTGTVNLTFVGERATFHSLHRE